MSHPSDIPTLKFRKALNNEQDILFIMDAYNSCINWLEDSKDIPDQWPKETGYGTRPHIESSIADSSIAQLEDGTDVAVYAIVDQRSSYIPVLEGEDTSSEIFLKGMAVHRQFEKRRIGEAIIHLAREEARRKGKNFLRLDCFRGNGTGEGLVRYYEKVGFKRVRPFDVPFNQDADEDKKRYWHGMLMEWEI
jgi:GNAT superfamily N-acetyltransferase